MLKADGKCSTCNREPQFPFMRQDKQGHIIERCIDHCHDPFIIHPSDVSEFVKKARTKGKEYCKTKCPYKPKNKKDYHCQLCSLV